MPLEPRSQIWPCFPSEIVALLAKRQAEEAYGVHLCVSARGGGWVVCADSHHPGLENKKAEMVRSFLCGVLFGIETMGVLAEEPPCCLAR